MCPDDQCVRYLFCSDTQDASQDAGVDRRITLEEITRTTEEITRIEGVIKDNENNITVLASLVGNKTDGDMYDTLTLCRQNRRKLNEVRPPCHFARDIRIRMCP